VEIDSLAQIGHVLGSLVGNAGHVVLKDQKGRERVLVGLLLLNVQDGAVGYAANLIEPFTAAGFELLRRLRLTTEKHVTSE
jgi:hypothetical protein